jgi:Zn-dependent protease with chaperone function
MCAGIWGKPKEMSNGELLRTIDSDSYRHVRSLLIFSHFAGASLLAWLANWIGLIPWRRARLLWPARVTAITDIFLIPVVMGLGHQVVSDGTADGWIVTGLASCSGALFGSYPFDHEIFPQLRFRDWLYEATAGWGLRLGIWLALITAIVLMPAELGWETLAVAGAYLIFHFAMQWGLAVKFLRWVRFARPANERLHRIVEEAGARIGVKSPATWLMGGVRALAFALPTTRELLFSERLLEICPDEEVSTICAHEMAHLNESKATLAGRLLGSLSLFPLIFIIPMIHAFELGFVIPPLLALLIGRFARRLSQRMEKRADQIAAVNQLNEGVYARALEKLYRENQLPAVNVNDRQTHPHLYDRMLAAGVTPDYPRPDRPKKTTWMGTVYACAPGLLLALLVMRRHWLN